MTTNKTPDKNIAYQVRGTFRMYETALARYLATVNVPLAYFHILRLNWADIGVSQSYIAENAFMTASVASQVIKKMAADRLLERRADPDDSRVKLVYITQKGSDLRQEIMQNAVDIVTRSSGGLTDSEIQTAIKVMVKVRENLENED